MVVSQSFKPNNSWGGWDGNGKTPRNWGQQWDFGVVCWKYTKLSLLNINHSQSWLKGRLKTTYNYVVDIIRISGN